ncbi:MAG: hypothetical protein M3441_05605 [Chloroflexota bacterium]|nr:hypothetical protein [Chloroflexota bacterium]
MSAGALVYRVAYEQGYKTAERVSNAQLARTQAEASATVTALAQVAQSYRQTPGLRENPPVAWGESGTISDWYLTVKQVLAFDVITTTGATQQVVRPHNGRFWFIDMEISSKVGNTLAGFRWYVIDTQGRMYQDAATDPKYTFDFSLFELPMELRAPAFETEWLGGTSGDHVMPIFDTPADMVPVELVVDSGYDHISFELNTK